MNPWWIGLAPVEAKVQCGTEEHVLRWEAGELSALDHEDAEAERALAALGGERCTCVEILDAWARQRENVRVFVLATRGPDDPLARGQTRFGGAQPLTLTYTSSSSRTTRRGRGAARRGFGQIHGFGTAATLSIGGPTGSAPSKDDDAEEELRGLLTLSDGLSERFVADAAALWRQRLAQGGPGVAEVRPQLEAALYGRAASAVRAWLGTGVGKVNLTMIEAGAEPKLTRSDQGGINLELPFAWLSDVWAKGLATIAGRFCLHAATNDGNQLILATVGPDLHPSSSIRLKLSS